METSQREKSERERTALQLLEFMRDRFGPRSSDSPASVIAFRDKWQAIYPSLDVLWGAVDRVLEDRG